MLLRWFVAALTVAVLLAGTLPAGWRWDAAQHSHIITIEPHLQVFLVVGVVSAPRNFAWRHAIRQSWFNLCPDEIAAMQACVLRFIIGSVAEHNLETKLQHEASLHGDIVRVPTFDSYNNLIFKVLFFMDW